ncbi:MAG: hypothetical protein IT375_01150 [Polyangiaceae bacterium]|nr:hypothetical protein [Polyangiaceae bacterium]
MPVTQRGALRRLAVASVVVAMTTAAGDVSAQAWKKRRDECAAASEEGQLFAVKGQLRAAREKLIACAEKTCPGAIRKDCEAALGELDRRTPSIVCGAKDKAGHDLVDVSVSLDGAPFLAQLDGKAVELDPGQHTLLFEAKGLPPHEEKVMIREGEKARVVVVTLVEKEAPPPKPKAPSGRRPSTTTWVVGGIGAAALAGAGVIGFVALQKRSSLYDSCGKAGTCSQSDVDSVYRLYDVSYVAAGVGGALLATSAVLYFTTSTPPSEERAGVTFTPWLGGAAVSGKF